MTLTTLGRVHTVETELRHMGEFILLSAQSKTEEHEIKVKGLVRQGPFSDEIIALCKEKNADLIVL